MAENLNGRAAHPDPQPLPLSGGGAESSLQFPLHAEERGRVRGGEWLTSLAVFAFYLLLALVLTYPLALRLGTHIPGGNVDEGAFLWNTWWVKHALLDLQTNPLNTDMIFYPLGANLALYTLTLLPGLLALPLTLLAGPIVASNVLFILAFALSGLGAYVLAIDVLCTSAPSFAGVQPGGQPGQQCEQVREERQRRTPHLAAFVAGVVFAFASGRFLYGALGQYDFIHVEWLPFTVVFLLRTVRRRGWRSPVLAGVFAACAGLTEMSFVVFLAIFVLIWLVYLLVCQRSLLLERGVLSRLGLALAVFLVGFGPLALAVVQEAVQAGDYLVRGWGGADRFLVDVLGPLIPSPLHPLSGEAARSAARSFSDINFGFVGYAALLLGALGVVAGARHAVRGPQPLMGSRFWLPVTLVFFILALGPLLHVNGQAQFDVDGIPVNLPLPYIVIHYLPILKAARVPGRFAIMATLALSVLVALGVMAVLRRCRRPGVLATLLVTVIAAENMAIPLPLVNASAPDPYRQIAAAGDGDVAILQIPLGWRDGFGTVGRERTLLQSYQSIHGKRIIGGNTSRSPAYVLSYFANLPVLRSIVALQEGRALQGGALEADRAQAASVLSFLNLRYVVVHGDDVNGTVDAYIQTVLPVERLAGGTGEVQNAFWHFGADGNWVETKTENTAWVLYAMPSVQPRPVTAVDMGAESSQLYLPAGWSRAETVGGVTLSWAEERRALVLFRLEQPAAMTLALRASPFIYPSAPQQSAVVTVNGHKLGTITLQEGWAEYRLPVLAAYLQDGVNQVWLEFAHLASPAQVLGSSDKRTLAAAFDWIRLE